MFERFTKRARSVVETAVEIAEERNAAEVRPEHVFAAMLRDDASLAVRVLGNLGAPAETLRAELEQRGGRFVDGLGDDDAEALATIGIDLEEVLRRVDQARGEAGGDRKRHRKFAKASKKALALSLREAINLGHNYSAPSTSCSESSAGATRSYATPWLRVTSTPIASGPQ